MKLRVLIASCLLLLPAASLQVFAQKPKRIVRDNLIISDALPKIKVKVSDNFKYVGKFNFKIRNVAAGERLVFIESKDKNVKRLFIAQFEGFMPHIDDFYRYSFENALDLGGFKFRQNTYAYSNKTARTENPAGEGVLTEDFLKGSGYELEDELMMSRFVTVAGDDKKHELILYYLENVSETGAALKDLYKNDEPTDIWIEISKGLKARSLASFTVR
ncbi:MAG: hypothetical protein R2681_03860 [Pyrinomonadaceae bacterium]